MYISDIDGRPSVSGCKPSESEGKPSESKGWENRRESAKTGLIYLFSALFCALFGAVYEYFSHGVFSYFMIYAFAFPLAGGAIPFFLIALYGRRGPGRVASNLYHSGIAALTVGSIFQGVLEIYGTTNRLVAVYWIAGAAFLLCGAACCLARRPSG